MSRYTALVQRLGHKRWFAAVGRRLMPIDRWLLDHTRGRWSVAGRHGLPSLLLTTTGRRSGQPRTQPLLYATDDEAFVVAASNWGQPRHPGWSANLLDNPDATVCLDGRAIPVHATLATGEERERLWRRLVDVWPAYPTYRRRAGREIRIFRLTPRS